MSAIVSRLAAIGTVLCFVSACSSSSTSSTTYDPRGDDGAGGSWFCEMSENQQDWNCIRDENMARNPQPTRLPEPGMQSESAPGEPDSAPLTDTAAFSAPVPDSTPAPRPAQQATTRTAATPPTAADLPRRAIPDDAPKHVRLSYQPAKPVALLDLPGEFWVVQLVSVSTREALEKYAIEHQLRGMSAARIWSRDQFYYVLILGIYETYENAEEATVGLPAPFDEFPPWIRSVSSLQKAMLEADRQAQTLEQGAD